MSPYHSENHNVEVTAVQLRLYVNVNSAQIYFLFRFYVSKLKINESKLNSYLVFYIFSFYIFWGKVSSFIKHITFKIINSFCELHRKIKVSRSNTKSYIKVKQN